jgi:hypothetical protein
MEREEGFDTRVEDAVIPDAGEVGIDIERGDAPLVGWGWRGGDLRLLVGDWWHGVI